MKFTLKNFKYSDFASEETYCFEATVYVDGKRSFIASNDGHGGCNNYYPLSGGSHKELDALIQKIEEELKKEPAVVEVFGDDPCGNGSKSFEFHRDLDWRITECVSNALTEKETKRILRRISYVKPDGGIYQLQAKFNPTKENIGKVKKAPWWKNDWVMLNDLPFSDALNYVRNSA